MFLRLIYKLIWVYSLSWYCCAKMRCTERCVRRKQPPFFFYTEKSPVWIYSIFRNNRFRNHLLRRCSLCDSSALEVHALHLPQCCLPAELVARGAAMC